MKIGLIGGSFNPVHNGHLRVAIEVKEKMDLDVVELIPAPRPPHKLGKEILKFEKRVYLLQKAIEGIPFLRINTIEKNRKGPSYTVYTLRELNSVYRGHDLYFVVGGDEISGLTRWYKWRELFCLSNFIVVGRRESDLKDLNEFIHHHLSGRKKGEFIWKIGDFEIFYIKIPRLEISSSMIRDKIAKGHFLKGLVPDIIERDLYMEYK